MKRNYLWAVTPLGLLMLGSATVTAAPVSLSVCSGTTPCWSGNYTIEDGVVVDWSDVETWVNGGGNSVDDWEQGKGLDMSNWSLSMDSDPFVTNNFTITNTGTTVQTFSVQTNIGITPVIPNGLMQGSIGFTLTDNDSNGATLATSGSAIYQASIDGSVARTLWNPPTTTTGFATTVASDNFGFPTREIAPESIDATIGVLISFSLTPNDSVAFTSNFDVTPVPLPAALWLFGSGLLGLYGLSRRKKAA